MDHGYIRHEDREDLKKEEEEEIIVPEAKNKAVVKKSRGFSQFQILRDIDEDKLTPHVEFDAEKEGFNTNVKRD